MSGAELCSAFCSAAGKNLAAVCSAHSLAETVFLAALAFLGLIGTKHMSALLSHIILNILRVRFQAGIPPLPEEVVDKKKTTRRKAVEWIL